VAICLPTRLAVRPPRGELGAPCSLSLSFPPNAPFPASNLAKLAPLFAHKAQTLPKTAPRKPFRTSRPQRLSSTCAAHWTAASSKWTLAGRDYSTRKCRPRTRARRPPTFHFPASTFAPLLRCGRIGLAVEWRFWSSLELVCAELGAEHLLCSRHGRPMAAHSPTQPSESAALPENSTWPARGQSASLLWCRLAS